MARDPYNLGDQLRIDVGELLCPHCESDLAKLVRILAPEEVEGATVDTWSRMMGGAGMGGAVGAIFGPAGAIVGGLTGGALGGTNALDRAEKRRAVLDCPCGYYGSALGD